MPTVWVQQFGPGLYEDSRSSQTGQLRTALDALAIGFSVAPVGRGPGAMHPSTEQNGTAFGQESRGGAPMPSSPPEVTREGGWEKSRGAPPAGPRLRRFREAPPARPKR